MLYYKSKLIKYYIFILLLLFIKNHKILYIELLLLILVVLINTIIIKLNVFFTLKYCIYIKIMCFYFFINHLQVNIILYILASGSFEILRDFISIIFSFK